MDDLTVEKLEEILAALDWLENECLYLESFYRDVAERSRWVSLV